MVQMCTLGDLPNSSETDKSRSFLVTNPFFSYSLTPLSFDTRMVYITVRCNKMLISAHDLPLHASYQRASGPS
jgi:hypothetical protein